MILRWYHISITYIEMLSKFRSQNLYFMIAQPSIPCKWIIVLSYRWCMNVNNCIKPKCWIPCCYIPCVAPLFRQLVNKGHDINGAFQLYSADGISDIKVGSLRQLGCDVIPSFEFPVYSVIGFGYVLPTFRDGIPTSGGGGGRSPWNPGNSYIRAQLERTITPHLAHLYCGLGNCSALDERPLQTSHPFS